jgi:uncharacterized membrane protein
MFEFFFKYPASAFAKGDLVLLGRWPVWLLGAAIVAAALILAVPFWRHRLHEVRIKPVGLWLLQTALVALLLVVLWQPALSIATLRPQQNIVAVVVDDSKSMMMPEGGTTRLQQATNALRSEFINDLGKKFQVRLYKTGASLDRIETPDALTGSATSTQLGNAMRAVVSEASSLPIGAVVLLSDGADNSGGIDLPTITEVRRHRIPVHTVGFGREVMERDIELTEVQLPARVLADSRLAADVSLISYGLAKKRAKIVLRNADKVVASREITLKGDGVTQTEAVAFNAGTAGAKAIQVSVEGIDGEENRANNTMSRLVTVEQTKPRILYIEGEPKWEFKFIRRAIEQDQGLKLVTMIRTTQNKIYRQGVDSPGDLLEGFPATVDELFSYQGLIIGGVEANYFTQTQQELIRQFVDRRGGGILFLGGRNGLGDGGWAQSGMADLLPVVLPNSKETFRRDPANVELTAQGRDSLLCRIDDNVERNADRWKKLPYLQNYQDTGRAKPGAVVLAEMTSGNRKMPLLVTQNYGRGRTALFATAGSWRWQMSQPLEDMSHEMFWQQLLRWVMSGTAGQVISSTSKSVYSDEVGVPMRVEVRDRNYLPVTDADVRAHIMGPDGSGDDLEMRPDPAVAGVYTLEWGAVKPGSYVVETVVKRGEQEVGRDVVTFRREDGVAENFKTQQNRELLEKLASQTGGRYYKPDQLAKLSGDISYSEAGISVRETRDLWNMPILFLIALMLRSAEWLLRRKWGII